MQRQHCRQHCCSRCRRRRPSLVVWLILTCVGLSGFPMNWSYALPVPVLVHEEMQVHVGLFATLVRKEFLLHNKKARGCGQQEFAIAWPCVRGCDVVPGHR